MEIVFNSKQFSDICKQFINRCQKYEQVKRSEMTISIRNGYVELSVTGKFFEYSQILDGCNDLESVGFAYNPIEQKHVI